MFERSCLFNQEKIAAYASGNVSAGERKEVERHLASCPECRRELAELQNTWLALDLWHDSEELTSPRLNDLHLRIAAVKQSQSLWDKIVSSVNTGRGMFRLAPTMAMAGVFGLLCAASIFHSQLSGDSAMNTDSRLAASLLKVESVESEETADSLIENQRESEFTRALTRGEQDRKALHNLITGVIPVSQPDTQSFTNVGFVPNADFTPSDYNETNLRPAAAYQNNNQRIRLGCDHISMK